MNKAQLVAQLDHFGQDIIEISDVEFNNTFEQHKGTDTVMGWHESHNNSQTQYYAIFTDGWAYKKYSSMYPVGWQGDYDCDLFIMKVQTITKQEMEDMLTLFSSKGFE